MNLRFLAVGGVSLVTLLALPGCTSETKEEAEEGSLASNGSSSGAPAAAAICSSPNKFFAVMANKACAEVPGAGGKWKPAALFTNAPASFHACTYDWVTASGAPSDRGALQSHVNPPAGGVLTPSCGDPARLMSPLPEGAVMSLEDPDPDPGTVTPGGEGGTHGCDVCGFVEGMSAFVVLPADMVQTGAFAVKLSNGQSKAFQVDLTTGVKAATVPLPPLPPGVTYVPGPVKVH